MRRLAWAALVRNAISKATLADSCAHPSLRDFEPRLIAAGKTEAVALPACTRKLLALHNALCKHQTAWVAPTIPAIWPVTATTIATDARGNPGTSNCGPDNRHAQIWFVAKPWWFIFE